MPPEEPHLLKGQAKHFKGFKPYTRYMLLSLGTGFHFSAPPPPDIRSAKYLAGDDQEDALACILANAQAGEFEPTALLAGMMHASDDAALWGSCSHLLSYAVPASVLRDFAASFWDVATSGEGDPENQSATGEWVIETLANSSCLWTVPVMMQYYAVMSERERWAAPKYIARLLEDQRLTVGYYDQPGPIALGPAEIPDPDAPPWYDPPPNYDYDGYQRLLQKNYDDLCARVPDPATISVYGGEVLNVRVVAESLLACIPRGRDDWHGVIDSMQCILGAFTGRDMQGFYSALADRGSELPAPPLDHQQALALLADIVADPALDAFTPGARYFWGHRIPD
jgi:hypothetical protein